MLVLTGCACILIASPENGRGSLDLALFLSMRSLSVPTRVVLLDAKLVSRIVLDNTSLIRVGTVVDETFAYLVTYSNESKKVNIP